MYEEKCKKVCTVSRLGLCIYISVSAFMFLSYIACVSALVLFFFPLFKMKGQAAPYVLYYSMCLGVSSWQHPAVLSRTCFFVHVRLYTIKLVLLCLSWCIRLLMLSLFLGHMLLIAGAVFKAGAQYTNKTEKMHIYLVMYSSMRNLLSAKWQPRTFVRHLVTPIYSWKPAHLLMHIMLSLYTDRDEWKWSCFPYN